MNQASGNRFVCGLLSIILSLFSWFFICIFWFPLMDFLRIMNFSTFEAISAPISILPVVIAVIGLRRKEKKHLAIIGIVISAFTFLWLVFLMTTNGM